ncbi:hypothetical protein SERLA73DRAFT_48051, partial [Serpula lacrymans var. lacrymans S7.3]
VPLGTPIYATSATMSPAVLAEVQKTLHISASKSFHLNLGNNRPNVTQELCIIAGSTDYSALDFIVKDAQAANEIPRALIFVNTVSQSQAGFRRLHGIVSDQLKSQISYLNARRSPRTRKTVLRDFCEGKIRVMFVTKIGGMGFNIPDVKLVIQFGVPSSLSVWLQRAGRAVRNFSLQGRAIMMVEASVLQCVSKKKKGRTGEENLESEYELEDSDHEIGIEKDPT